MRIVCWYEATDFMYSLVLYLLLVGAMHGDAAEGAKMVQQLELPVVLLAELVKGAVSVVVVKK